MLDGNILVISTGTIIACCMVWWWGLGFWWVVWGGYSSILGVGGWVATGFPAWGVVAFGVTVLVLWGGGFFPSFSPC